MHQSILVFLLIMVCFALSSCGSKQARTPHAMPSVQALEQKKEANPFADLSLDDIRKNAEWGNSQKIDTSQAERQQVSADEYEARLIDIVIPFDARLLNRHITGNTPDNAAVLGYACPMPVADAIHFYTEHMERLGWNCTSYIPGHEELLLFEKPDRMCCIVMRCAESHEPLPTQITLFIANRAHQPA